MLGLAFVEGPDMAAFAACLLFDPAITTKQAELTGGLFRGGAERAKRERGSAD